MSKNQESALASESTFELKFRAKWINLLNFLLNHEKEVNFIDQWKQSPYFDKKSSKVWEYNKKVKNELFNEGREKEVLKDVNDFIIYAVMSGTAKQIIGLVKQGDLSLDKNSIDLYFSLVWDALKR
nr:hypothetical protein [Zobellia barbeyronii]